MAENNEKADIEGKEEQQYEAAYLLDPAIAEESLPAEVGNLVAIVERHNGKATSSDNPKNIQLAYTVVRAEGGKRYKYNQAHFGVVKFTALPINADAIRKDIEIAPNVLRSLVTYAVEGRPQAIPFARRTEAASEAPRESREEKAPAEKPTEEQLDKQVDDLIAQTETAASGSSTITK